MAVSPSKASQQAYVKSVQKKERERLKAQKEANQKIQSSYKAVKEAEAQSRQRIDYIREEHDKIREREIHKHEKKLVEDKAKSEEILSKQQLQQNAAIRQSRKKGEDRLSQVKDHYDHLVHGTEKQAHEKLTDIKIRNQKEIAHEKRTSQNLLDQSRHIYTNRVAQLDRDLKFKASQIDQKNKDEISRMNEFYKTAKKKTLDQHKTDLQKLRKTEKDFVTNEYKSANERVKAIRHDTTQKLDAYARRQEDPFYQMMRTDASLESHPDEYVLKATIPAHEQEHVSINVRGNQIVLSGRRRHENRIEESPGKIVSTAAFQSFTETFPIADQVNARLLKKTFDGDTLTVRIPKTNNLEYSPYRSKEEIKEARVHKPQFPDNLPMPPDMSKPDLDDDGSSGPLG